MKRLLFIILVLAQCIFGAEHVLKTNTATKIFCGPFIDHSDGVTPETGMTVTNITVQLFEETVDDSVPSVTNITPTAVGVSTNDMVQIAGDASGMYYLELTAAQLNFYGNARLCFTDSDVMLPCWENIRVVPANVYDSWMGTDFQQVDSVQISGDGTTADNFETGTANWLDIFDGATCLVNDLFSDAVTTATAVDAIWDEAASGHVAAGSMGAQVGTDIDAILVDTSTTLDDFLDTEIAAILADTGTDGVVVATGGIAAGDFGAGAITAAAIAANAIGADEIAENALGADEIAANAIGASEVASGAIDADAIEASAIGASEVATGAIDADAIAASAIGASEVAANAIGASELATDAVTEIVTAVWAKAMADLSAGDPVVTESVLAGITRVWLANFGKVVSNGSTSEIEWYNDAGTKIAETPFSDNGTSATVSAAGVND